MRPAAPTAILRRYFDRYGYAAFLAYLLGSVLIVTVWIEEAVVDAAFWWGLRWLLAPWVALAYGVWWLLDPDFPRNVRHWGLHVVLAAGCVFLAVGSGGYVALANRCIGPQATLRYAGTVERLGRISGRFGPTQYTVVLRRSDGSTVKLYVPREEHARLRVGQPYERTMVRGGLGLTYYPR